MTCPTSRPASSIDDVDAREQVLLAPYAMFSRDTLGREYEEPKHPYRGPFQRDRDRILHSSAYRRLSGKMQVFAGRMGDYHRTRLTHTQEVATIARTIGRALRLNEDLIEALALMHDLGHPPYGHAGEDALDDIAAGFGGFSHNQFALTLVRELEARFLPSPGLNLSREVLQGQVARVDKEAAPPHPLLEVQVVEASDSTAYDAHDTDDAIKLGLVSLAEMEQLELVRDSLVYVRRRYSGLTDRQERKAVVHRLIDRQVTETVRRSLAELTGRSFASVQEARGSDFVIGPDAELAGQKGELEAFLYQRVYRHPDILAYRQEAQARLCRLHEAFCRDPEKMAPRFRDRAGAVGVPRAAVEFLAGMTDHYCEEMFARLSG